MNEEQLKPITNNEQNEFKKIEDPAKSNIESEYQNKKEVITNLPTWSIEPPLEIKRGK